MTGGRSTAASPVVLLVVVLGALLALAPAAAAASAEVRLEEAGGGVWNGASALAGPFGEDDASRALAVWVPSGARVQSVAAADADGREAALAWRAGGSQTVLLTPPADAARVEVRFDFRPNSLALPTYVAPMALDRLLLLVAPPPAQVVVSQAAAFGEEDGTYAASLAPVAAGATVDIRLVDAGRVGELPLLASVLLFGALGLAGAILYHRVRPVNEGKPAERFLDHLGELQARLLPPVAVFALLNVVYFTMGLRIATRRGLQLVEPVFGIGSSLSARTFDVIAERLVPAGVQLIVTRPVDAVLAQVQIALFLAFLSALPVLLYEIGAFLGPALLPPERRIAARTVPIVSLLFVGGSLFGLLLMAPVMVRTLYAYAPALGAESFLVVGELVSFALLILLAFGLAFELPVVMYVLARIGLVKARTFVGAWKHAVIGIVLAAGVITPDPSVVTQAFVAVPLLVLYGLGILAAQGGERARPVEDIQ